jgi:hypothetical protein
MDWEKVYGVLKKRNWVILLVLSTISYLFMDHAVTLGVILGGFIIIANFRVFQHTIRSAFAPDGRMATKKGSIIVKYYLRLLALGMIIYFLVTKGWVNPIGLAIGLSVVVFGIVSFGIEMAWRTFAKGAA